MLHALQTSLIWVKHVLVHSDLSKAVIMAPLVLIIKADPTWACVLAIKTSVLTMQSQFVVQMEALSGLTQPKWQCLAITKLRCLLHKSIHQLERKMRLFPAKVLRCLSKETFTTTTVLNSSVMTQLSEIWTPKAPVAVFL